MFQNVWKFLVLTVLWMGVNAMVSTGIQAQIKSWEEPLPSGPRWDEYEPGPDSLPQEGVPKGEIFNFEFSESKIFPGTVNRISVYVPVQYDASKPACVYVGLDGFGYRAPEVFDNLIHKKEIPVIIGIGISPGYVPSENGENPRFNRSFEFDGISDAFCRFLIEEVFPEVEKKQTKKGLPIRLSKDPNDRSCGGGSTGGIGAFSLAWQRPDQFRRVFSAVGTYVAMRGGEEYHVLVRKTEPKPIRIFMQDGHSDQCMGDIGDWWMGNLTLKRSLEFAGYDVAWVWGTGGHSGKHGTLLFPDAMRMLWKDYPAPVTARPNPNFSPFFNQIVRENETWRKLEAPLKAPAALCSAPEGKVLCADWESGAVWSLTEDGTAEKRVSFPKEAGSAASLETAPALALGCAADGTIFLGGEFGLYACPQESPEWRKVTDSISVSGLNVLENGNVYVTDSAAGKLWHVKADGTQTLAAEGLDAPCGVGASPDFQWLAVMESGSHFGSSFKLEKDGSPTFGQRFFWFHVPAAEDGLGTGKCAYDADGKLFAAAKNGVSALDRNGRTRLILPSPVRGGQAHVSDLCFGGADWKTLFILTEGKIFVRKLNSQGVPSFLPAQKLPPWGAG